MDQLAITEKDGANYHLYELDGSLTAFTMGEFQNTLYEAVIFKNIVLDMSRLIELDPSGVGFLMAAFNDAEEYGHNCHGQCDEEHEKQDGGHDQNHRQFSLPRDAVCHIGEAAPTVSFPSFEADVRGTRVPGRSFFDRYACIRVSFRTAQDLDMPFVRAVRATNRAVSVL